jgi:alkylation response protein AidB-like acyl-CoA dehydrogenase
MTGRPRPTPASPDHARLAHAERLLDIARAALDAAIQRAAQRGDIDEIEALHRDRRLLGFG